VWELVRHGADLNSLDDNGKSPEELARRLNRHAFLLILRNYSQLPRMMRV
jgi:hypothetical protein